MAAKNCFYFTWEHFWTFCNKSNSLLLADFVFCNLKELSREIFGIFLVYRKAKNKKLPIVVVNIRLVLGG